MGYQANHYYNIIDKNTKEVVFNNKNTSCYAEYNNGIYKYKKYKNCILNTLYLEYKVNNINNTIYYINQLKKIGIPVNIKNKIEEVYIEDLERKEKCYIISLDLEKCKNHQLAKLSLHLIRYAWDSNGPEFINEVIKYKEENECTFWQAFMINKFYTDSRNSHTYWEMEIIENPTIKYFSSIINEFKDLNQEVESMHYFLNKISLNRQKRNLDMRDFIKKIRDNRSFKEVNKHFKEIINANS